MFKSHPVLFHLLTATTVVVWGTTFIATKVLLREGLSPAEIMFYRFLLAYVCLLPVSARKIWADNWRDEALLVLAGLTGGSLYFIAENTALQITQASNVAILLSTTPVLTALLAWRFAGEPLGKNMFTGSLIALAGVILVVFNGSVLLKINPLGDILTLISSLMWACYCLVAKKLCRQYSTLFITRKVFYYGILSLGIYFAIHPLTPDPALLFRPIVLGNLLFLGVIASMICYLAWNVSVKVLGAARATNYLYVQPFVTLVTSALILSETITFASLAGALLIITGVYLAER